MPELIVDACERLAPAASMSADSTTAEPLLSTSRIEWIRRTRRLLSSALRASHDLNVALNAPVGSCHGAEALFQRSVALADAREDLVACLQELPPEDFALQGRTSDGRLLLLTRSAQRAQHWQVTRFDREGIPWGDSQYTRQAQATADFVREIELRTLGGHEGAFLAVDPATLSIAFQRWFSGSLVKDGEGRALEVYHGTAEDFEAFSPLHRGRATGALDGREGFFFSANPASAEQFIWKAGNKCGHLIPVYLRIARPAFSDVVLTGTTGRTAALQIRSAKAAGYDGMIFRDSDMLGHRGAVYVAFEPQQIKSSRGNSGSFDPEDASILR